jgi:hypothetical protein
MGGSSAPDLEGAIVRSSSKWNKTRLMTLLLALAVICAAPAAPASYYYLREAGTS